MKHRSQQHNWVKLALTSALVIFKLWTVESRAQSGPLLVGPQLTLSGPMTNTSHGSGVIAAVASNGEGYLAVWECEGTIYGSRITTAGVLLDSRSFRISSSTNTEFAPAVASNGTDYLVVWNRCADPTAGCDYVDLCGARVTAQGVVLDPTELIISALPGVQQGRPAIASNGNGYLVVRSFNGSIWGTKVSNAGVSSDFDRRALLTATDFLGEGIASNGTNYLLTAVSGGPPSSGIQAIRIADDLTLLDAAPFNVSEPNSPFFQHDPAVAKTADDYIAVWTDNFAYSLGSPPPRESGLDIHGSRITATGAVLDYNSLTICSAPDWQGTARITSLGNGAIATWGDFRGNTNYAIYATSLTRGGGVISSNGTQVAAAGEDYWFPDIASDGKNCLIVYQVGDPSAPKGVRANLICATQTSELWTMATVPKTFWLQSFGFSTGGALFGTNKSTYWAGNGGAGGGRGINVTVINLSTQAIEDTRNFDTWLSRKTGTAHYNFLAYLTNVPPGRLILVAGGDDVGLNYYEGESGHSRCDHLPYQWVNAVIAALTAYGGNAVSQACFNDSFGMIFVSGQNTLIAEGLGSGQNFPAVPVRLYTELPQEIPKPILSMTVTNGASGFTVYTLSVTNVTPARDVYMYYTDDLRQPWQPFQAFSPQTNIIQTSDLVINAPQRFFKVRIEESRKLPPGF